jgi:hypothetical protein
MTIPGRKEGGVTEVADAHDLKLRRMKIAARPLTEWLANGGQALNGNYAKSSGFICVRTGQRPIVRHTAKSNCTANVNG